MMKLREHGTKKPEFDLKTAKENYPDITEDDFWEIAAVVWDHTVLEFQGLYNLYRAARYLVAAKIGTAAGAAAVAPSPDVAAGAGRPPHYHRAAGSQAHTRIRQPAATGAPASFTRRLLGMDDLPRRELFHEELYLRTFPDAAQAVRDGHFSSGYHHWALHGRFELAAGQRVAGSSFLFANGQVTAVRPSLTSQSDKSQDGDDLVRRRHQIRRGHGCPPLRARLMRG